MSSGFIFVVFNLFRAKKQAFIKLILVLVCPFVFEYISFIPAKPRTFFNSSSTQRLTPCGAGFNVNLILPHLPSTLNGIECDLLHAQVHSPHPLLTLIKFSLALRVALSLAGTVSLDFEY